MRRSLALLVALIACLVLAAPATAAPDPLRSQQWGLDMIHADPAHATSTGAGAVVAVVDTGVDANHPDLAGRLLPGHDFVQNDGTPQDGNGHGTHVSGIIAADANNGKGIEGVAPSAQILPIRVLDDSGSGDADTVAKGIDYAVAHHADVINLSLGGDALSTVIGGDDKYTAAIQNALNHGIVVVAAAGNDTAPFCEQPAVHGPLLCVGAVDRRKMRSFYSSSGDLVAPGGSATLGGSSEDILSTWNDGSYETLAGTSQATPHVSGVAALLVSLGVRGQAAVNRILSTASDPGVACPAGLCGAGIVDARAAVAGFGGSPGGGAKAGFSYARTQKIKNVLKSGVRATCRPTKSGTCRVRVKSGGKLIASGSRKVAGRGVFSVRAKLTSAGRKRLKKVKKSLKATLIANVPGASQKSGGLKLVR